MVEDDDSLNRAVSVKLSKEGYTVYSAFSLEEACFIFERRNVSLIICDIELPDGSGFAFLDRVRRKGDVMFLFLTARDTEIDMINAYESGADDYITKPFPLSVLISKVHAVMKRVDRAEKIIRSGQVEFLLIENRVKKNGEYLSLTANEQKLLECFMRNPQKILSKNQLLEAVWDLEGSFVDENTLAVNIRRLREKIEEDPSNPCVIKNIRGLGYIWEKECEIE